MATILNDTELKKLFGTVITNAHESCVRPNSYILRLGSHGAFINTEKIFEIGENRKKGIRLNPGYSVGITALEKIDFGHDAVRGVFPECDLHGFISPTTDLSREGLIAPSTQIDAGYKGTLNWTITNTSGKVAEFVYGEKLFRLTVFRLEKGENPKFLYQGDYQEKDGYVSSRRSGAPRGMKESDWVDAFVKDGPEGKIEELIKSGYPWNLLGSRLKHLDDQLKTVTNEYGEIRDSMDNLNKKMADINQTIADTVRGLLDNRDAQLMWKIVGGFSLFVGLLLALAANPVTWNLFVNNPGIVGIALIVIGGLTFFISRKKK